MAKAVIEDSDEAALRGLLDCLNEHGIEGAKKTYYLAIIKDEATDERVFLLVPPSIDIVDLDKYLNSVTSYKLTVVTSCYHCMRETIMLYLPEQFGFYLLRDVITTVSKGILHEYHRVYRAMQDGVLVVRDIEAELERRDKLSIRS